MTAYISDWTQYRYGVYRRMGNEVQCYSDKDTIPAGLVPSEPANIIESLSYPHWDSICRSYRYYIRVKIKGWETMTLVAGD